MNDSEALRLFLGYYNTSVLCGRYKNVIESGKCTGCPLVPDGRWTCESLKKALRSASKGDSDKPLAAMQVLRVIRLVERKEREAHDAT